MSNEYRPVFLCPKCNEQSLPLGNHKRPLPITDVNVTCPFCNYQTKYEWLTPKLQSEMIKKERGLTTNNSLLEQRIKTLEAGREADRSEIRLLTQRLEILENQKLQEIRSSLSDRTAEINGLTEEVRDLKDKAQFQEENR